jgi:hypothetical protein
MNKRTRIVVDTLLPAGTHPAFARGAVDVGFESFLEDFDTTAPARLRQAFRIGVAAATWVAPVLIGRVPPLALHRRETRERALGAMSRWYLLRQLLSVVKAVVSLCYGADPEVRAAIGYPMLDRPA